VSGALAALCCPGLGPVPVAGCSCLRCSLALAERAASRRSARRSHARWFAASAGEQPVQRSLF
jgi:hypothetical protein